MNDYLAPRQLIEDLQELREAMVGDAKTADRFIPPDAVTLLVCPVCGRTDRWTNMKVDAGRHFSAGSRCLGKPVRCLYRYEKSLWE